MTGCRPRPRATKAALLTVIAMLASACGAAEVSTTDPSAQYFPTSSPNASAGSQGVNAGVAAAPPAAALGPISRPNPLLTPGVVAVRDVTAVCQQPKHTRVPIPYYLQLSVFYAYRVPVQNAANYGLDFLVPLQLGGASVQANIWPASVQGIGFHQKEQLNYRLRTMVCEQGLPLGQAQQDIVSDWYALWTRYATPAEIASAGGS